MITLNVKDAILAGAKAFEEGQLQANKMSSGGCEYRSRNGTPCLIGAAISDDDYDAHIKDKRNVGASESRNAANIAALIEQGVIILDLTGLPGVTVKGATSVLTCLQDTHDSVLNEGRADHWRTILGRRLKKAVKAVEQGKLPRFR